MKHAAFFNLLSCVFPCLMLCACSFQGGHTQYDITPIKSSNSLKLGQEKIYIAMPHNSTKDVEADEAVTQTSQAMQEAFSQTSGEKVYAPATQSLSEGLASARAAACAYLIQADILDWADPPASFQLVSDRGEVILSVYNVETGDMLRSDNISCNGSATTINHIGFYSPRNCLKPGFDKWVAGNIVK